MLAVLEEDFRRIPELLGVESAPVPAAFAAEPEPESEPEDAKAPELAVQLGLF
jgi:hypothetical protein